jgi:hypothetical protein
MKPGSSLWLGILGPGLLFGAYPLCQIRSPLPVGRGLSSNNQALVFFGLQGLPKFFITQ